MSQFKCSVAGLLVCALACLPGCGDSSPTSPHPPVKPSVPTAGKQGDDGHEHGEGPHGGTVFDLGGGSYHAEFTVDHGKQEARIYVLGGNAKTAVPIQAEVMTLDIKEPKFRVELKAEPQPGDPKGRSSCFVGKHPKLGVEQEFAGTVSCEINTKPFTGDFSEKPHAKAAK